LIPALRCDAGCICHHIPSVDHQVALLLLGLLDNGDFYSVLAILLHQCDFALLAVVVISTLCLSQFSLLANKKN
jgi:hypothetical protein